MPRRSWDMHSQMLVQQGVRRLFAVRCAHAHGTMVRMGTDLHGLQEEAGRQLLRDHYVVA